MRKTVYTVLFLDCLYILMISLSTVLTSISALSVILRYSAYVIPLAVFLVVWKRGEFDGKIKLMPSPRGLAVTLPLIAPTVLLVMGVSFLTSLLLNMIKGSTVATTQYDFFSAFTLHALLPAVFEELVFRFIPLVLLATHSKKSAVLISALLFAFVHANPYQIPYALVAGAVYMALDIATESVVPSMVLHLCNNTVALLWQSVFVSNGYGAHTLVVLGALSIVSVCAIIFMHRLYKRHFSFLFDRHDRIDVPIILVATVGIGFIFAFSSLL